MAILTDGWVLWVGLLSIIVGLIATVPGLDEDTENNSPLEDTKTAWRFAAEQVYHALLFESPPWYISLFREIRDWLSPPKLPPLQVSSKPVAVRQLQFSPWYVSLIGKIRDRIQPAKLPPLQLTSKPADVHQLDLVPWYVSLFREIGDRVHHPELPPLPITSKPVELVGFEAPPWYVSLIREIRDRISPPELPPLLETSNPVKVQALWAKSHLGPTVVPISIAIHLFAVALLIGIQLYSVAAEDITYRPVMISLLPPPPPPPPPAAPPARQAAAPKLIRRLVQPGVIPAPGTLLAPPELVAARPEPEIEANAQQGVVGGVPGSVEGGVAGGTVGGVIGGMLGQIVVPEPAPPPVTPTEPLPTKRIRVGGEVQSARLLVKIPPEYPNFARSARIQGTVRLEAVICEDGTVSQVKVIEGNPFFVQAVIEAVLRWRYEPTLLDRKPVQVITVIKVNFRLS